MAAVAVPSNTQILSSRWEVFLLVIGLCTIELHIGGAHSLKDKRRILKSLIDRVKAHHNVSIAEIDNQDIWQRSTVAFVCVANERKHTFQVLNSVVKVFEKQGEYEILDYWIEMF
ncbi:MAG: DUF503 domain-containing protein [Syntrophaceticus sp.]|nr:DUF503 domain-containing protein [Syntrophaceticus sp.]MDD4360699.1 DUF503 domain-containing protein [Syntrophaceticus sp.]MDD4782805.1 DUF503 domain-containing protein [Syntrophaceticus sp.]